MTAPDYEGIAGNVLRPARPKLAEALALVEGVHDAALAWNLLVDHGVLPSSWRESEAREFSGVNRRASRDVRVPPSVNGAVAFASAASSATAAEEHARELVRRLLPWGERPTTTIRWKLLPPRKLRQAEIRAEWPSEAFHCAANGAENCGPRDTDPWQTTAMRLAMRHRQDAAQRVFVRDVAAHHAWSRAVAGCARVQPWPMPTIFGRALRIPAETYGKAFAELPNPFDPILAIWELGCALDIVAADAIILGMPESVRRTPPG